VFILLKIVFSGKSLWYIDNKFKIFLMKYWMGEQDCSVHQAIYSANFDRGWQE